MSHDTKPIIETGVATTLRTVIGQVVAGAGLALVRGPAGIGKSFALDLVSGELEAEGVNVVRVTASEVISGSISAFTRAILSQYRVTPGSTLDGVEALGDLLRGYPFRDFGPRAVFIVDEAQVLKPAILETIRGLWDRGDGARQAMEGGPAFGCVLVGNDTFMSKGGTQRVAGFRPLMTRVTHDIRLPRPNKAEHAALAEILFAEQPELQEIIAGFGQDVGNLRAQDVAARQARLTARGGSVSADHLRLAIKFMGGGRV